MDTGRRAENAAMRKLQRPQQQLRQGGDGICPLVAVEGMAGGDLGHQACNLLLSVPACGNINQARMSAGERGLATHTRQSCKCRRQVLLGEHLHPAVGSVCGEDVLGYMLPAARPASVIPACPTEMGQFHDCNTRRVLTRRSFRTTKDRQSSTGHTSEAQQQAASGHNSHKLRLVAGNRF